MLTCRLPAKAAFLIIVAGAVLFTFVNEAYAARYKKATQGSAVVLRKIFPKRNKVELNANGGLILNSSYLDTMLVNGSLSYYFSEVWGIAAEFTLAMNSDKPERACIETFYNDPDDMIGDECGGSEVLGDDPNGRANFGPAYVPIRQINQIIGGSMVWNPVYGKQLFMLSATTYFDIFVVLGGGMAFSTFYPLTTELRNGNESRGTFPTDKNKLPDPPIGTDDELQTGLDGRPDPEEVSNAIMHFGTGMKYHFFKRFNFKVELRNYTLLFTESGFDNFFTLWGGLSIRF